jgi:hypothetical protein
LVQQPELLEVLLVANLVSFKGLVHAKNPPTNGRLNADIHDPLS